MTNERYLYLQFKKGLHHGHVHNAELDPTPTGPVRALLGRDESCLVLVQAKWQQLWFTNHRLLQEDASGVIELFAYTAVQKVHWMSRENPLAMSKEKYFDRLEIDTDGGGVEIDGMSQAYLPVFQFLGFAARKRSIVQLPPNRK